MIQEAQSKTQAKQFRSDSTVRWSCRRGEYVLWVVTDSPFTSNREGSWTIRDFWEMRDGDFITITNRLADLPVWFELNPFEAANSVAFEMMVRINSGYIPKEIQYGQNLWRVKSGDRIIWVSPANSTNPVKELLQFRACALMLGENANPTLEGTISFGAPLGTEPGPDVAAACRAGFDAAVALGAVRTYATEWSFG